MEYHKLIMAVTIGCMIWAVIKYILKRIEERRSDYIRKSLIFEQLGKRSCSIEDLGAALAEFEEQFERFEKKFDKLAEKLDKE